MNDEIEKLIRLLGSDSPGEVLAAVEAIKRILTAQGKIFNDLVPQLQSDLRLEFTEALNELMKEITQRGRNGYHPLWGHGPSNAKYAEALRKQQERRKGR